MLRNSGRKAAEDVRLGHHYLPNFNVYPDIEYRVGDLPGGGKELIFPRLVPKKEVTVSYLYHPPVTWDRINSHIESSGGPAKVVSVLLQIQQPKWVYVLVAVLMLSGLIGLVYVATQILLQFAT